MAISELCPENGSICQGRVWLQEIEAAIVTERYDSEDQFSGNSLGQKALKAWDVLGGHKRDRNNDLDDDIKWITNAAATHERNVRLGAKKCDGTFCATIAQAVITARGL